MKLGRKSQGFRRHHKYRNPRPGDPAHPEQNRRRGVFILPSLLTTLALFAGFYAIVRAMNANYEHAAIGIIWAIVLDGLDGRLARMMHTQSRFGAEYDSLSDMVSFGVAPALVIYEWGLRDLGKVGWMVAFIYCVAAALRLARFNVSQEQVGKRFFMGLPSPAAAGLLASFLWVMLNLEIPASTITWPTAALTLLVGLTMVSNVPYFSGKDIDLRRSVPWISIFLVAIALVVFYLAPQQFILLAIASVYTLSGYVWWVWRRIKRPQVSQTNPTSSAHQGDASSSTPHQLH